MMGDKEYEFWLDWKKRQEAQEKPKAEQEKLKPKKEAKKKNLTTRTVIISQPKEVNGDYLAYLKAKKQRAKELRANLHQKQQQEKAKGKSRLRAERSQQSDATSIIKKLREREAAERRERERQRQALQRQQEEIRLAPMREEHAQKERERKEKQFLEEQSRRKKEAELAEERRKIERLKMNTPTLSVSVSLQISEEERQKLEERKKFVAQKLAQGTPRVERRRLVTLLNIESNEELRLYYVQATDYTYDKKPVGIDEDPIPSLSSDIEVCPSCSPLGKALTGLFDKDEFSVKVPAGKIRYRIVSIEPLQASDLDIISTPIPSIGNIEREVYAGRGRAEQGENNTLDGSKNIGFLARDGGQWGSFPSHDDYGDESDAEGSDYNDFADM